MGTAVFKIRIFTMRLNHTALCVFTFRIGLLEFVCKLRLVIWCLLAISAPFNQGFIIRIYQVLVGQKTKHFVGIVIIYHR